LELKKKQDMFDACVIILSLLTNTNIEVKYKETFTNDMDMYMNVLR